MFAYLQEPSSSCAATQKSYKTTTKEPHPSKRRSSFIIKLREKYPQLFRSKRGIRPKEGGSKSAYGVEKVHFAKAENVVRLSPNFQEQAQIKDSNSSMSSCIASSSIISSQVGRSPATSHASGTAADRMSLKDRLQANRQSLQGLLNDPKVPSVRDKLSSNRQSLKELLDKSPFRKKLSVDDFVKSDATDKNKRSRSLNESQTKSSSRTLSNTRITDKSNISTALLNPSSEVSKSCSRNQLSNIETAASEDFTVNTSCNKPPDSEIDIGSINSETVSSESNVEKPMQNNRSSALSTSVIERNKVKSSEIGNVLDEDTMISFMQSSHPKLGHVDKTKVTLFKSNEDSKIDKLKSRFNTPSKSENIDRTLDKNFSDEDIVEAVVMKTQTVISCASVSKDTPDGDGSSSCTSDVTEEDDEELDDATMEDVEFGSSSEISISDTDTTPEGAMQESSSPVLSLSSLDDGESEARKFLSVLDDGNHKSERLPFEFSQKLERKRKTSIVENDENPEIESVIQVNEPSGEIGKSDIEIDLVCKNERTLFCENTNQDSLDIAANLDETSIQFSQSANEDTFKDATAKNMMAITEVDHLQHEHNEYREVNTILDMKDNVESDENIDAGIEEDAGIDVGPTKVDEYKDDDIYSDVTAEINGPTSIVIPDPRSNRFNDIRCEEKVSFNTTVKELIDPSKMTSNKALPDVESNIWEISDQDFILSSEDVVVEHETNSEPLIADKLTPVNRIDAQLSKHVNATERTYETEAVDINFDVLQQSQPCEVSQGRRSADEIRATFPESFGEESINFEFAKAMPDSPDVNPAESERVKRLSSCDSMASEKSPFGEAVDWWNFSNDGVVKDDVIEVKEEDPISEWSNYLDASISGECHSGKAEISLDLMINANLYIKQYSLSVCLLSAVCGKGITLHG